MHIGLYFGSFNPIHTGHLIIASHIAEYTMVDKVWLVVSPQNPLKPSDTMLNEYDRLRLVQIAIESDDRFKVCDIEFSLSRPSYTIDTLIYLSQKHPQHSFSIIMGSDTYQDLSKWKNYKQLVKNYQIIVYPRLNIILHEPLFENAMVIEAPLLDISSTYIRKSIQQNKTIRYLVPEVIKEEIERNKYYQK